MADRRDQGAHPPPAAGRPGAVAPGGVRPPGYGRGYGRDFGGGLDQGFAGSWGQGYGGTLAYNDYRAGVGGLGFGAGGGAESRPWTGGPRGAGFTGARGPHVGRGPGGWRASDARLRERVCERLMEDDLLDARDIAVEAQDGVVTLRGEVGQPGDVRRAEDLARATAPGAEVRNALTAPGRETPRTAS
jgi:hypothetical protein